MLDAVILAGAGDPLSHVLDKEGKIGPLSMNTITLIVVTALLIIVMTAVAKAIDTGPESEGNDRFLTKGKFAQVIEVIVLYLRDKVFEPQLGENTAKLMPFLLTVFFFILFNNLFGLLPLIDIQYIITALTKGQNETTAWIGGTATGRLAVTAGLATVAFLFWHWNGITKGGFKNWLKHYLGGAPAYLAPVMIPVEIIGTIVKPVALTLRLFANMTAGHILLGILIIFVSMALKGMGVFGLPVSIAAFGGALAVFFLEIFVALLQAFIFTFLTTLFVGQLLHHEHDDHAHAEHYDDHEHSQIHDKSVPVTA